MRSVKGDVLELARQAATLMEAGTHSREVAKTLKVDVRYVFYLSTINKAPKEAKDMVRNGIISATLLSEIHVAMLGDWTEGMKLVHAALDWSLGLPPNRSKYGKVTAYAIKSATGVRL